MSYKVNDIMHSMGVIAQVYFCYHFKFDVDVIGQTLILGSLLSCYRFHCFEPLLNKEILTVQ